MSNNYKQRKLNRLAGYDYSMPGAYFITTNTANMDRVFGKIENGEMVLNKYGKIVENQWKWLFDHYKYLAIDTFCIMPNHVHGIIHISSLYGTVATVPYNEEAVPYNEEAVPYNEEAVPYNDAAVSHFEKIKPIPEIVGAFKTTSSKLIHKAGYPDFKWHKSYHDIIIRDNSELNIIRNYIDENPLRWGK